MRQSARSSENHPPGWGWHSAPVEESRDPATVLFAQSFAPFGTAPLPVS